MSNNTKTTTAPQATTAAQENIINKIIETADVHTFFDGCLEIHPGCVNVYYTLSEGRACYCISDSGCDVILVDSESDDAAGEFIAENEYLDRALAADAAERIDAAVDAAWATSDDPEIAVLVAAGADEAWFN
jgi:hypothetical protein